MSNEDILAQASQSLNAYNDTRQSLVESLNLVELQIENSIKVRDEIRAALAVSGETVTPAVAKKAAAKKTARKKAEKKDDEKVGIVELPEPEPAAEEPQEAPLTDDEVNLDDEIGTWEPGEDEEEVVNMPKPEAKATDEDLDFNQLEF